MNLKIDNAMELLMSELQKWLEVGIKALPNLVLAALVLVFTGFVAAFVKKIIHRVFGKSQKNRAAVQLVEKVLYVVVIAVGFFIALGILNLDKTVTSLLAGAGVLGLALGFAFQEVASNFLAGVLIAFQEPYRIGDIVEIKSQLGTVKQIELRCTIITTFTGLDVIVPNKVMYTDVLVNYTATDRRRFDLKMGVSYSDDLPKVERVAIAAVESIEGRITSEPVVLFFTGFGESSIDFELQVWINYPASNNYNKFRHRAIMAIKKAFDAEGISIPFPIRTLDIDARTLGEELSTALRLESSTKES